MNDMFGILDMVVVIAALYIGYQWYCMKFKGEIKTGLLLSNDVNVAKCKDKEGYIREASPLLLILAVVALIQGIIGLVNGNVMPLPFAVTMGGVFVLLAVLVWFGVQSKKLYQKYWDTKKSIRR